MAGNPLAAFYDYLFAHGADPAVCAKALELVRPYGRHNDKGGPVYAADEVAVRHGHDLKGCFRVLGFKAERFVFASAKDFTLPGWPSASLRTRVLAVFEEWVLRGPTTFSNKLDRFVADQLEDNLVQDVWEDLLEHASNVVPPPQFLLDQKMVRIDMIMALGYATIHAPHLIEALEPMAHLLADAVPLYETDHVGSGRWLLVIA